MQSAVISRISSRDRGRAVERKDGKWWTTWLWYILQTSISLYALQNIIYKTLTHLALVQWRTWSLKTDMESILHAVPCTALLLKWTLLELAGNYRHAACMSEEEDMSSPPIGKWDVTFSRILKMNSPILKVLLGTEWSVIMWSIRLVVNWIDDECEHQLHFVRYVQIYSDVSATVLKSKALIACPIYLKLLNESLSYHLWITVGQWNVLYFRYKDVYRLIYILVYSNFSWLVNPYLGCTFHSTIEWKKSIQYSAEIDIPVFSRWFPWA